MLRNSLIFMGIIAFVLSLLYGPPVTAQSRKAQATIEALQTRVADLEQQLGLTPTPEAQDPLDGPVKESSSAVQSTIAGSALDLLPPGDPDTVSVIAVGPYARGDLGLSMPVVVRNNTDAKVKTIRVAATAKDSNGTLLASGQDRNIGPFTLAPGEVGFGYIDFDGVELPDDARFAFTVTSSPAKDSDSPGALDYEIVEVSMLDGRLVGQVKNTAEQSLSSSMLDAVCFDDDGQLLSHHFAGLDPDRVEPGGIATFQVLLSDDDLCSRFLVAAMGFAI